MKTKIATFAVLCASIALLTVHAADEKPKKKKAAAKAENQVPLPKHAVCVVMPTEGNTCKGVVRFDVMQPKKVKVTAKLSGLKPNAKHAIHVHEFGDTTDLSGKSAGGHYNPEGKPHGLPPNEDRHAGDLGNLQADADGNATYELVVDNISIARRNNGIIGRAIVVHADPDDGGQPVGNAGARIGFGVIGVASAAK
jgi:Cu-Zn family superoxide dismutase